MAMALEDLVDIEIALDGQLKLVNALQGTAPVAHIPDLRHLLL